MIARILRALALGFVPGLVVLGLPLLLTRCTIPPSGGTITLGAVPSETDAGWNPVADYLGHRCGDLDCHGETQRNFVVWSCYGLRADASDHPGCRMPMSHQVPTTASEYEKTYESLVGLEPVLTSEVVASGGQNPDLLTFVRKARGEENHKGGTLIDLTTSVGVTQDQCITSWLGGSTNADACAAAIAETP
jgi:hypothetical protein